MTHAMPPDHKGAYGIDGSFHTGQSGRVTETVT